MEAGRMLIVETIAKIWRYYFVEGRSIKKVSKDLNISRNTVGNIIRSGKTKNEYSRKQQPHPRLGAYLDILDEQLEKDWNRPKKRKVTAGYLFGFLCEQGYSGAYGSIQRHVRRWKNEKSKIKPGVFIPLHFPPGDAYQFDWSYETHCARKSSGNPNSLNLLSELIEAKCTFSHHLQRLPKVQKAYLY